MTSIANINILILTIKPYSDICPAKLWGVAGQHQRARKGKAARDLSFRKRMEDGEANESAHRVSNPIPTALRSWNRAGAGSSDREYRERTCRRGASGCITPSSWASSPRVRNDENRSGCYLIRDVFVNYGALIDAAKYDEWLGLFADNQARASSTCVP